MSSTRFSPNANGLLHVGNAYTALLTSEVARQLGLRLILRIDDSFRYGVDAEAVARDLRQDLDWLGLTFDADTPSSTYRVERIPSVLVDAHERLVIPTMDTVHVAIDAFLGEIPMSMHLFRLADTFARTAMVCADVADDVSLVVRDETFVSHLPHYMALYHYFGAKPPIFAHIPFVTQGANQKMSKSTGNTVTVRQLRDEGKSAIDAIEWIKAFYTERTSASFTSQAVAIVSCYVRNRG